MEKKKKTLEAKIITLGDSHVGKSSLIIKFIENKFTTNYLTTVGFDLKCKTIQMNDEEIKLIIHDTAGQERFRSLASNYIKKANGVLLVYDISDKKSFDNIGKWMDDIIEESDNKIPIVLAGNKCDLKQERVITKEEGENIAKQYNLIFFETSCKDGDNVENCFKELTQQILERKKERKKSIEAKKLEKIKIKKKKKDCCN